MTDIDVTVIGGGAAGLMAAVSAARCGARTRVIEHMDRIGKKILSTGNGKCNYTNAVQGLSCYRGENPAFVLPVFEQFGQEDTVRLFEELGIYPKIKNGYYYPASEQAVSVVEVFGMECDYLGVDLWTSCGLQSIQKTCTGYEIRTTKGAFSTKTVIFAPGLLAAPKTGSDGSAFPYIEALGHHFVDVVPALVQLHGKQAFFKKLAGIRAEMQVTLYLENAQFQPKGSRGTARGENPDAVCSERGELQLTASGISGIPVFQISRYAARGLYEKKEVFAELDFMPDFGDVEFLQMLKERKIRLDGLVMEQYFNGLFHKKLAGALLKRIGISGTMPVHDLSEENLERLCRICKHFRTYIDKTNPFEQAQICAGGVDTSEIDPDTMESKLVKGLYFAGEILDVDGICGGYNLQWAWTSGYLAGKGAANA